MSTYTDYTNDFNDSTIHFREEPTEYVNDEDLKKIRRNHSFRFPKIEFDTLLAYVGIAASISAFATKSLDLLGNDFINLSTFFGKHQLISSSSFLTGGLAFASFEVGCRFTQTLLGDRLPKFIVIPASFIVGTAATAAFAHFTSVPIITALAFAALGIVGKHGMPSHPSLQGCFHFVTCAAIGGLIYEGSTRPVIWITGFQHLSLGWRHAAWAGVLGGAVTAVTLVAILKLTKTKLFKSKKPPKVIKYSLRFIVPKAVSCYVNPVPALVNVIMVAATALTWFIADGSTFIPR